MKIDALKLKERGLLKHYRIIRKWACKTCNLKEADLELLIYLDAIDFFTKDDFMGLFHVPTLSILTTYFQYEMISLLLYY